MGHRERIGRWRYGGTPQKSAERRALGALPLCVGNTFVENACKMRAAPPDGARRTAYPRASTEIAMPPIKGADKERLLRAWRANAVTS